MITPPEVSVAKVKVSVTNPKKSILKKVFLAKEKVSVTKPMKSSLKKAKAQKKGGCCSLI